MSYVEHGPRIFLAASKRPDDDHGDPLIYGDYVLPWKRSEGRLKIFESCTDIRAWSQNTLESSRYFRELTEHAKTPGKIVPMNVVIDNVIELGAQTQSELVACRRELERYKSLRLTPEQQRQLRLGDHDRRSVEFTSDEYTDDDSPHQPHFCKRRRDKSTLSTGDTRSRSDSPAETETRTASISRSGVSISITESNSEDRTNRATIIQKDSEIIALENELGAKEAELEELQNLNKILEESLKAKEKDIEMLRGNIQQLSGMGNEMADENEKLKKKICDCEYEIAELSQKLGNRASVYRSQSRELEDLRFLAKETEVIRLERDSLALKVEEMGKLLVDADRCSRALNEMKTALRERDDLRCRNREQSCLLADQEDEIKRLLLLVQRLSSKYESRQVKMKGAIETMRNELEDKNREICRCEEQLASKQQKIESLNLKLKTSMKGMDEFELAYADACNCADLDQDIYSQAKNALCRLNLTMGELKEYKTEREHLLKQIEDLKSQIKGNNESNTIYCQLPVMHNNKIEQRNLTDLPTLYLRKQKCLLREELDQLDVELQRRGKGKPESSAATGAEDVVTTVKHPVGKLNNAMLNLDAWEIEKASMEQTIKRLQMKLATLDGNRENVEARIMEQASTSIVKIRQLMTELQHYRNERENMREQIENLTADLQDARSAAGLKGITALKDRIREIRAENEKERQSSLEQMRNLEKKVKELENTSSYSGVRALRARLRQALLKASYDGRIDQALATHVKKSIERIGYISKEIKGASDDGAEILKEIGKQHNEIEVRNMEIVRLKEEIEMQAMQRKGEGDQAQKNSLLVEELDRRGATICDLKDKLQSLELQILGSDEERLLMRNKIERLVDENTKLLSDKETRKIDVDVKEKEIIRLVEELSICQKKISILDENEKEFETIKSRLITLQRTNDKLIEEVATLHGVLSKRNEGIIVLMNEKDASLKTIATNAMNYETSLHEKDSEIKQLLRRTKRSDDKLKEAENKIRSLNAALGALHGQSEKIDQISTLHKEISKLTKDKRKLEEELKQFRCQLVVHENSNRKLERDLNNIFGENETLKWDIEHLTAENGRLTNELVDQVSAKDQLFALPDKLQMEMSALRERLRSTEARTGDVLLEATEKINHLQIRRAEDLSLIDELQRQIKLRDEQARILKEKISVLEKENYDVKMESSRRLEELEELNGRLRKIERDNIERETTPCNDKLSARMSGEKMTNKLSEERATVGCKSKSEPVLESYNIGEMTRKLNHLENEKTQHRTEIQKLQCDVKFKDATIKSLKENVKSITKERDVLNDTIKIITIQNNKSLQAVKMRYEGNLKLMHASHNESVARLQSQYEEVIKDGNHFDPETWLRSLNLVEISELHNRICMASSCAFTKRDLTARSSNANVLENNQEASDKNQLNRRIATMDNEMVQRQQKTQEKMDDLETELRMERKKVLELSKAFAEEQQRCFELQGQIRLLIQKESEHRFENRSADNCATLATKEKESAKSLGVEASTPEKLLDWRKKNFIYQCSMYKKYDNQQN